MIDMRTIIFLSLCVASASFAQESSQSVAPDTSASTPAPAADDAQSQTSQQEPTKDAAKTAQSKPKVMDRLELESTSITGNRELPKVLYIVPWKKSDLGDLAGRPTNSLLDEVLAPVDREVFRRQTDYYEKLNSASTTAAPTEQ